MPIIPQEDQDYIKNLYEEKLERRLRCISIPSAKQDCSCLARSALRAEIPQLLDELVALSDKLELEIHDFYIEREPPLLKA